MNIPALGQGPLHCMMIKIMNADGDNIDRYDEREVLLGGKIIINSSFLKNKN